MKIAIPLCRQRIAPLFESAETFLLINPGSLDGESIIRETQRLRIDEKCQQLLVDGVQVLLCGALSRQWQDYLRQLGIDVHSFLAGDAQEVLQAYLQNGAGGLEQHAMPGCKGNRGGQHRRRLGRGWRNACEYR